MKLNKGIAKVIQKKISHPLTRIIVEVINKLRLTESGQTRISESGVERSLED